MGFVVGVRAQLEFLYHGRPGLFVGAVACQVPVLITNKAIAFLRILDVRQRGRSRWLSGDCWLGNGSCSTGEGRSGFVTRLIHRLVSLLRWVSVILSSDSSTGIVHHSQEGFQLVEVLEFLWMISQDVS